MSKDAFAEELASLREELASLREEHGKLLEAYGRLKWAMDGVTDDLRTVLGLTPLRARIVALMFSGRRYTAEHLMHVAWGNDAEITTVKAVLYQMQRALPWFVLTSKGGVYGMKQQAIDYVKAKLESAS